MGNCGTSGDYPVVIVVLVVIVVIVVIVVFPDPVRKPSTMIGYAQKGPLAEVTLVSVPLGAS